jgi:protocatechuate 3,4-dioxygenase beta subunit
LAGALLDVWQANDAGAYGRLFCAADGSYALRTVIPGHYLNGSQFRPAHVHVKASGTGARLLTTQLYFEGDPYNDIDPFIHPALIMPLGDDGSGGKVAFFDIVLAPV